ncbi:uncharacterized protein METZ01_LOCUS317175, partial [marine metagenome]
PPGVGLRSPPVTTFTIATLSPSGLRTSRGPRYGPGGKATKVSADTWLFWIRSWTDDGNCAD